MSKRLDGERERAAIMFRDLRGHLDALESSYLADLPTAGSRQALMTGATSLSEKLAVIDALRYDAEERARDLTVEKAFPGMMMTCKGCGKPRAMLNDKDRCLDCWARSR